MSAVCGSNQSSLSPCQMILLSSFCILPTNFKPCKTNVLKRSLTPCYNNIVYHHLGGNYYFSKREKLKLVILNRPTLNNLSIHASNDFLPEYSAIILRIILSQLQASLKTLVVCPLALFK